MTTKQLRSDLVQTVQKIRSTQETLKTLRAQHTSLKAQLTEARAAQKTKASPSKPPVSRSGEEG